MPTPLELNADFTKRAVVHANDISWVPSPIPDVERKMLDRIGDEVARATTIVRYAVGSSFPAHVHTGGEEFIVLDVVFQDEHGDYPKGTYVRNPPESSHTPRSEQGCVILVKLWQYDLADRTAVTIDTENAEPVPSGERPGVSIIPLHHDTREDVRIEIWASCSDVTLASHQGLEILVLEGEFEESGEIFGINSWLRLPPGIPLQAKAGPEGARLWVKSDHLTGPQRKPG